MLEAAFGVVPDAFNMKKIREINQNQSGR